jgi:hypothetical protein
MTIFLTAAEFDSFVARATADQIEQLRRELYRDTGLSEAEIKRREGVLQAALERQPAPARIPPAPPTSANGGERKDAYLERQAWMDDLIADDTLSRGELAVAMCLAFHKNLKSSQCNPSLDRIARGTGMGVRNVQYALAALERRGRIKRQIGGGAHHNTTQYELLRVQQLLHPSNDARVQ